MQDEITGAGMVIAETNLRDVGGILTKSGQTIRKGLLYRSGNLEKLNKENQMAVCGLNLQTAIDFRADEQRKRSPGNYSGIREVVLPCDIDRPTRERLKPLLMRRSGDEAIIGAMDSVYREMVDMMVQPVGDMIRILLNPHDRPVLIHCQGGKDRTGFATAVIYWILDVDQEVIIHDYLKSNEFMHKKLRKIIRRMRIFTFGIFPKSNLYAAFEVRAQYLDSAWSVIQTKYGGLEGYLAAAGIGTEDITKLREELMETGERRPETETQNPIPKTQNTKPNTQNARRETRDPKPDTHS
ncbi:MAG: tyrosine-protein phosphatase [Bacteroidales bacterium]|nr:tyrosine-protein phosphatase [Bacteroidales bacterium]